MALANSHLTNAVWRTTIHTVIEHFKSKDLRQFWETDKPRGINPNFADKIHLVLTRINVAENVESLDVPGFGLHPLTGDRQGQWSIVISRNWRITFRLEDGGAFDVDFEDYHGK